MLELLRENNIGMYGIIETQMAKKGVDSLFNSMFRHWNWLSNAPDYFNRCRIVIGWNTDFFEVMSLFSTDQLIHCLVT